MSLDISVKSQSVVNVSITSSVNTFGSERRFQKEITIGEMKGKLEMLTGATPSSMKLELRNKENKFVCHMDNDAYLLGSYPVDDGMIIHVVDPTIKLGEFEDTSKVQKYEMEAADYEKRSDSVRAFKERNKIGRFQEVGPEEQKRLDEEKQKKAEAEKQKVESMKVGDRCETRIPGQASKRGCVKYTGTTDFQTGYWVGVQYDEPVGKNNGTVKGKRYFDCPAKYGCFARPGHVEVGDFPEEDFNLEDEI